MTAADVVRAHGGFVRWKQIRRHVSRRQLARALTNGEIIRLPAGGYALPEPAAAVAALQLGGVRSHRTAAACWGFALPPGDDMHVTIPWKAKRRIPRGVVVHYRDLADEDLVAAITSPLRTVIDCLRDLCLRDALAVGDSALRSGAVAIEQVVARAERMRGPGSRRVRERCLLLDARAENAYESTCRAILIEGGVTGFAPQVAIRHEGQFLGRVDLCHRALRIVLECESFAWHGDRAALERDCRRYTDLEAAGWRVIRVTWKAVMFQPEWVLRRVRETVAVATGPRSTAQRA